MARASARNPGKASRATLTPTNAPRTREFAETPLLAASTQTGAMSVCALTPLCMMQLAEIASVRDVEFWNSDSVSVSVCLSACLSLSVCLSVCLSVSGCQVSDIEPKLQSL